MNDEDYQKLVEKLERRYFLRQYITKDYKFKIKEKEYTSVLAYSVSYSLESAALLIIFDEDVDIKYLFEKTDFTGVILLKNDKEEIYIRKGLEEFEELNEWPKFSQLFWNATKYNFLFFTCFFAKTIELIIMRQILIPILRILIPPLGKKLWEYYNDPLHRVFRKRDVDKVS